MLLLLTEIRKKLLAWWTAGALAITLLVLLQTLGGRFESIEAQVWRWWAVCLLPVWLLLFGAALANRNPSRVLLASTFRQVRLVMLTYLALVPASLLARNWALRRLPIEHYLPLTWYWLLPLQALVIAVVLLLFFRKENVLLPSPALLTDYLNKKLAYAREHGRLGQLRALQLLAQEDGLPRALEHLQNAGVGDGNALAMTRARYAAWKNERDLGTLDRSTLQIELNKITVATVALIETIKPDTL